MEISEEMRRFIAGNADKDADTLRLEWHGKNPGFDVSAAIDQIHCRRKCRSKLEWFLHYPDFLFPDTSVAEQSSDEILALYNASIINGVSTVADLTAGLGIDALTFALRGLKVTAVELNSRRAEILELNARLLNILNFNVINDDFLKWLEENPNARFDVIFLDPARRDDKKGRSFLLQDSSPNVIENRPILFRHASKIVIKASPLLDITQTFRDLPETTDIQIVCINNECKEVLIIMSQTDLGKVLAPDITVIDLKRNISEYPAGQPEIISSFIIPVSDIKGGDVDYADFSDLQVGSYLYEENAGIRKVQATAALQKRFPGLRALSADSHGFVSETLYDDFPGRVSEIKEIMKRPDSKSLSAHGMRVVSMGYGMTPPQLRKKFKIREGEEETCGFLKLHDNTRWVLITGPRCNRR